MTTGLRSTYLDPKECWKSWIELGSLNKVQAKYIREDVRSPRTGTYPIIQAIEKAAKRWAINNPEEARKDLAYAWQVKGEILTEEKWNTWLNSAVRNVLGRSQPSLRRYVVRHGLQGIIK